MPPRFVFALHIGAATCTEGLDTRMTSWSNSNVSPSPCHPQCTSQCPPCIGATHTLQTTRPPNGTRDRTRTARALSAPARHGSYGQDELEAAQLALLGPKTEADMAKPEKKKAPKAPKAEKEAKVVPEPE
eukprot:992899-Prorocentrum_minimum.AAC.1